MAVKKCAADAVASRPSLISFSGIDGAGKTTQIENVSSFFQEQGLRVSRFTFWDDVAVWSKIRAEVGSHSANSSPGEQKTERSFSSKNNKHVRKWWFKSGAIGDVYAGCRQVAALAGQPDDSEYRCHHLRPLHIRSDREPLFAVRSGSNLCQVSAEASAHARCGIHY